MSKKKLEEDYPLLSTIQKKAPPSQQSTKLLAPYAAHVPLSDFDIKSPENLLKTPVSQQDFCHALYSSIALIPDPPYDEEIPRTGDSAGRQSRYPQRFCRKLIQPEFFPKHDLQTLFYIFFYSPGKPQQFFAARELKRRKWVYHLKYQTWFHQISNPTEKTDTYVVAEYEYFDHSTSEGWCIRKRPKFKLQFEYLEQ